MTTVNETEIKMIFNFLNKSNLNYLLLRNINNELPQQLKIGKDIDILIDIKDKRKFYNFFKIHKYKKISHPFKNDIYLYGMDKFEFEFNKINNILFDLNFQLAVRSMDASQWVPLDQEIQESAWKNKRFNKIDDDFGYWTLSYEDEFITLISRAVFDKKEFQSGYINRIEELKNKIDMSNIKKKLELIFFKYTSILIELIEEQSYKEIRKNYLQFKDY